MTGRSMMMMMIAFAFPSLVRLSTDSPLPDITDEKFIEDCVKIHNLNRSNVYPTAGNMLYMSWDAALAITARAWARNCVFDHNIYLRGDVKKVHPTFKSLGENIWSGHPVGSFSVGKAMKSWVDEKEHYQYNSNVCNPGKACGHYTQVVWATSYKVGCAVHRCPDGIEGFPETKGHESAHFVCNYYPPGNLVNFRGVRDKPYEQGRPCIRCAGDTCEHSLCRDPTRDTAIDYSYWSPEWDPEKSRCGSFCEAVLVLRPLSVLLIFASAYAIKKQCPNIFVYE